MNDVKLMGHLTGDVRLSKTRTGKTTGSFKLAVNRPRQRQEDGSYADAGADFIWVKTWNGVAESCAKFLHGPDKANGVKASRVLVDGRISTNRVEKDGTFTEYVEVSARRVDFLDPKGDTAALASDAPEAVEASTPPPADDDIPF